MSPDSTTTDLSNDTRWMRAALALARRGLGRVAPNPAVGCVLVQDGRVVGRGWTQPGGRPHAETEALSRAGDASRGATAYVTLEPCSHQGETGPCADALIAAGVARVVVAMQDPDARVSGRGLDRLRGAGIQVDTGLCEAEAHRLNLGFILNRTQKRPMVTLKLATSLDGKIATAGGESQWITGAEARSDAHLLRARHDAILVGIGTALADDPALTSRLRGVKNTGMRIVLDADGRLPATAKLCDGSMTTVQFVADSCQAPMLPGVERLTVPRDGEGDGARDGEGALSIAAVLSALAETGVTRLMVEGGGRVAASFVKAGCVDEVVWYRAGLILGGDGMPCIAALGVEELAKADRLTFTRSRAVGADRVEYLERGT